MIPVFRAKKIDSNEYVTGWYSEPIMIEGKLYLSITSKDGTFRIDTATLAIHFPDMLDSQGNKIFASLSKDGKGGDIVEWTIYPSDTEQQRIKGVPCYSSHGVFKMTNRIELMWHNLAPHRESKAIGIQE